MDTTDALDLSKENIQPLKQGRKAVQLGTALQAQNNLELQQKLAAEREKFELLIRMYDGDDPLGPRFEYVAWIEQSYPKHGPESNLSPLLEDTLTKFKDNEKYKQDPRFVQLIIKYIDSLPNPLEVYQSVFTAGLGTKCALLYKSWADELDKNQDFKRADQIYQLGLSNRAEPFEDLQNAHMQFQLSVGRRMLCGDVHQQEEQPKEDHARQALSKLKKSVPSVRTGHAQPGTVMMNSLSQTHKSNIKAGGIQVYADENCDPLNSLKKMNKDKDLPKSTVINKENKLSAGPWNKQAFGLKKSVLKTPSTPSFQVHQDPEDVNPNRVMSQVPRALKTRKAETFSCPIAIFEPPDPTKRPMYCKDKIYAGTKEVQFEEIRAALYMKRKQERQEAEMRSFNSINGSSCGNSLVSEKSLENVKDDFDCSASKFVDSKREAFATVESNEQEIFKDEPKSAAVEDKKESAKGFWGNKMFPPDISINQQSFTINTKEAMNVVAEMWNSSPAAPRPKFVQSEPVATTFSVYTDDDFKVPAPPKSSKPAFSLYVDEEEGTSNKLPEPKESGPKFAVFTDEPEPELDQKPKEIPMNLPYVPSPHTQDPLQEADGKENNTPVDYTVSTEKRRLSGTLVPSADIPIMEDNNDNDDGDCEDNDEFLDRSNVTCNMTCNTKAFAFELPSSTPMTNNFKSRTPHSNQAINSTYMGDFNCPSSVDTKKMIENENLSMILEASKERYSSSSGSSGSSGIRTLSSMYNSDRKSLMTIRERESKSSYGKEMLEEEDVKDLQESIKKLEISFPEDIDPFSVEIIEKLLVKVQFPRRHHDIGLCRIEGAVPVLKQATTITLEDETYSIVGEIGKGAYARVVKATYGRQNVALKVQKPAWPWEWYICKEIQHRLNNTDMVKGFMNPDIAFIFDNGSILVSEWAQYGNLLNIVNLNKVSTNKMLPFSVVLHLSTQILNIVEHLHKCQIIHGDLKPDNFVLRSSLTQASAEPCIQLIDFGRSIDMALFPEGTTFTTVVKTDDFMCNEMKDNKPWTYQTDYFGVAGTIYTLIMAKYMQTVKVNNIWTLSSAFPRYSRRDVWEPIFNKLLNVESCSDLLNLRDMNMELLAHFKSIDSFLVKQQFSHLMNVLKKQ